MATLSRFSRRARQPAQAPSPRVSEEVVQVDWRGLDLTTPFDVMEKNRSPFARNFRMYAEEVGDRRVAISSRKGAGFYSVPLGETLDTNNNATTNAGDAPVGMLTEWKAQPFTVSNAGLLTKIELCLKNSSNANGPIVVHVYTDDGGKPGTLLASSGIVGSDISSTASYVTCRFIQAPAVTTSTTYWIVAYIQDDGFGQYDWRYHKNSIGALTSNTGGLVWSVTDYSLNFKAYVSQDKRVKGMIRFNPSNSDNQTLVAIGDSIYKVNSVTGVKSVVSTGISASSSNVYFTTADDKAFWIDGFSNLKTVNSTGTVETITHSQLPILKLAVFHKNVLWGVSATDPNKLVFSVPPVEDDGSGNSWYKGWLSTNIGYVPAPKAADPITAIMPFQDTLVVFTRTTKFVIYGSNAADVNPRQATGKKGAISQKAVYADENYLYFASDDGFYRFNGAQDERISERVQSEFDRIGIESDVFVTKWKRNIRFYYGVSGETFNSRCLLWNTTFEEWQLDTDAFVSHATPWLDSDDQGQLAEASSLAPQVTFAEVDDNNLGGAIDFQYYCKPDSMGNPAKRKRITKFFPLLEGEGRDYPVYVAIDKDRKDNAIYQEFPLATEGAKIGSFKIGDGTKIGSSNSYSPRRVQVSGYAYYWQTRIKRKAINNPVNFIGYVLSYREKRL